jgi:hypothetical protein
MNKDGEPDPDPVRNDAPAPERRDRTDCPGQDGEPAIDVDSAHDRAS